MGTIGGIRPPPLSRKRIIEEVDGEMTTSGRNSKCIPGLLTSNSTWYLLADFHVAIISSSIFIIIQQYFFPPSLSPLRPLRIDTPPLPSSPRWIPPLLFRYSVADRRNDPLMENATEKKKKRRRRMRRVASTRTSASSFSFLLFSSAPPSHCDFNDHHFRWTTPILAYAQWWWSLSR